jgi:hypothetical protein
LSQIVLFIIYIVGAVPENTIAKVPLQNINLNVFFEGVGGFLIDLSISVHLDRGI